MAELTYKMGAASALWKPALLPVYLLFGEEDRMKEEATTALIRHVVDPDFADFDLEKLTASDATADTILRFDIVCEGIREIYQFRPRWARKVQDDCVGKSKICG